MTVIAASALQSESPQLHLLHRLEDGLQRIQHALLKPDANEILGLSAEQHEICLALKTIFVEAKARAGNQDHILPPEVKQAFDRVLHLNRLNAALLRRSRRSLEIFSCLLTSLAATYIVPRNMAQSAALLLRGQSSLHEGFSGKR